MLSEVTASVSTGASAGFTFAYTGGAGRSAGSSEPLALIAACTSCSATSSVSSSPNCKRHDRDAGGAGRAHPHQPGHLAELALERGGDGLAHHLRARARIDRLHLDRRVVDLRQRRQRQEAKADEPAEHDRDHQQRRRHRPQDERPRRAHHRFPWPAGAPPGRVTVRGYRRCRRRPSRRCAGIGGHCHWSRCRTGRRRARRRRADARARRP